MEFILSSARSVDLEEHVAHMHDVCRAVSVHAPEQAPLMLVEAVRKHLERRAVAFSVVKPDMVSFDASASASQFGSVRSYVDPWLLEIAAVAGDAAAAGGGAGSSAASAFHVLDPSCEIDIAKLLERYCVPCALGAPMKKHHFYLLPNHVFLNSGSYGATPRVVLDARVEWEACEIISPWSFRVSTVPLRMRQVQNRLAEFVGAHPADLQMLVNANAATSTIIKSMPWEIGDVFLIFSVDYEATKKAAHWLNAMLGVVTDTIDIVLPMSDDAIVNALQSHLIDRRSSKLPMPKLFNFCHCTSETAWIFPAKRLTQVAHEFGVAVMIDGAQVPGHFPLDICSIAPEYYIGTCHKWMFTCPGVGFVVVAPSKQKIIKPLAPTVPYEEPFSRSFALSLPDDVTPFLSVLQAFEFVDRVCGGWRGVMEYNANLSRQTVQDLTRMWSSGPQRVECVQLKQINHGGRAGLDIVNCMPVIPLPGWRHATAGADRNLMIDLLTRKNITALCLSERFRCPDDTIMNVLCVRISCQIHVSIDDIRKFGRAIAELQGSHVDVDGNLVTPESVAAETPDGITSGFVVV